LQPRHSSISSSIQSQHYSGNEHERDTSTHQLPPPEIIHETVAAPTPVDVSTELEVRIEAELETGTHSKTTDNNLIGTILQRKLVTSGVRAFPPTLVDCSSSINDAQDDVKRQDEQYYQCESISTNPPMLASNLSTSYQMDTLNDFSRNPRSEGQFNRPYLSNYEFQNPASQWHCFERYLE
jgi:hypothetical protein